MAINTEDLTRFAQWEPVAPGFGRQDLTVQKHIQPILDRIGVSADVLGCNFEKVAYCVFEQGGLSNYFAFFVFRPGDKELTIGPYRCQSGISVYLSLLAPIGVFGHTEQMRGDAVYFPPYLEIENLLDPNDANDPLTSTVIAAVQASEYRLLCPEDAQQRLPSGIEPYEYCMCNQPWERVFHVLFANTD
jgi:hypothetical protein